jgi:dUTP pyrophosphatase
VGGDSGHGIPGKATKAKNREDGMKVKLNHLLARMPTKGSLGAAGFDLYAVERAVVFPGAHSLLPTGIHIEIEPGWYGRVAPRSGLAVKFGINVHAGVVDSDYRGEVKVAVINHGDRPWEVRPGDRIAQIIFEKCWDGDLEIVEVLSDSKRGIGAYGSTGI